MATSNEVSAWSADLPDEFIQCRDFGHTWRPWSAQYEKDDNEYSRVLRCKRCKTERSQRITLSGAISESHYDYPDGYQAPKGMGRMDGERRGTLRLQSTLRLIEVGEVALRRTATRG